jgi:predicted  nucleic acid-binding Zn-ribbon protein
MEDVEIVLARHEQKILTLERDMTAIKEVQGEIRSMNETLVTLANELKHTNEQLVKNEKKIDELHAAPRERMQQVVTAIIAAVAGAVITAIIGFLIA